MTAGQRKRAPARPKSFALVLGGGGARGLAHIAVLEALDEMQRRPALIVGSSIGAVLGAAYAAGVSGRELRRHALRMLHDRAAVWRALMAARAVAFSALLSKRLGNPMLMDAQKLCGSFLPEGVPETFAELQIPLRVIAADLHARAEVVFEAGPLKAALAASMAVPGLIRPLEIDGRVLVDGAAINPLPFDQALGRADVTIAIDTSVGSQERTGEPPALPDPWEALFATIQLMGHALTAEKLKQSKPDIIIRPNVSSFALLDFLQASAILRTADACKAEVTARLTEALEA